MAEIREVAQVRAGGEVSHDLVLADLKARLEVAEDTIRAIYHGEVDALVVNTATGPRVYTIEGADHPYRVLVEQIHEGTVTLGLENVILYANPQFGSMMAVPVDSVAGSKFDRFLPPVDSNLFTTLVEEAGVRGHSSGEFNLRSANNEIVPVRASVTLLNVSGMRTVCVLTSDLREQRRTEAIIKEEQLSGLILEQAGEAIVVIDPQGTIVRRSDSAKALTLRPILLNHFDRIFELNAADGRLDAHRILSAARTGQQIRGLEVTMAHSEGQASSHLVSASPLWSRSSELLGCVITLTDITERKRSEDALARQAEELARSNNDLRQFTYSASHDLREPLRQVALFSELLQTRFKSELGEEGNRLLGHTVEAAHRMEGLLQDLLAYAQAADAPQEPPAPTDADEVVREVLTVFEKQFAEAGARVECGRLPLLRMHELHLTQLFQNLIGNAVKYRSEAPLVLSISAERDGEMWKLSVTDNGIGIDPLYKDQIFVLFKRLHGGGKYTGSGIGLSICQKIVQRYGGRIWVESQPGGGSRFMFTVPGVVNATPESR